MFGSTTLKLALSLSAATLALAGCRQDAAPPEAAPAPAEAVQAQLASSAGGIVGTDAGDHLHGTGGADVIDGLGGADTLVGGAGGDEIYGGDGADVIYGDGAPARAFDRRWSELGVADTGEAKVTIPQGEAVLFDVCDADVGSLMLHGTLIVDDRGIAGCEDGAALSADWVMVMGEGAAFRVGEEQSPLQGRFALTLEGTDKTANANGVEGFFSSGTKTLMAMDGGALSIHGASRDKTSWTQIEGSLGVGATVLTTAAPTGWAPGDRIVLAPSGYDVNETEELTVTGVTGRSVSFSPALRFAHHGEVHATERGKTLDMRAEVGLLSRNVVIQGDAASDAIRFGGHVMVMEGGFARLSGVEFVRMGQQGLKGRYPFHWHAAGDVAGQWIRDSTVHHSFQRAFAAHKSHNALVENNVAYHVANHAYVFAEDGDERGNRFEGNLGLYVYPPETLAFAVDDDRFRPSGQNGDRPGVFWGRSPNHILVGNHAAGTANGSGFFIDSHEAKEIQAITADAVFVGNRSHTNGHYDNYTSGPPSGKQPSFRQSWGYHKLPSNGVFVDLEYPTNAGDQDNYQIDTDLANGGNVYAMRDFQTYKNGRHGVWTTTRFETLTDAVVADSIVAVRLDEGIVSDAVFIGQSANAIGEPSSVLNCNAFGEDCVGRVGFQQQAGTTRVEGVTLVRIDQPIIYFDRHKAGWSNLFADMAFEEAGHARLLLSTPPPSGTFDFVYDLDGSLTGEGGPRQVDYRGHSVLSRPALLFGGVRDGEVVGRTVTLTVRTWNSVPSDYDYYLDGRPVSVSGDRVVLDGLSAGSHSLVAKPKDALIGTLDNRRGNFWFTKSFTVAGDR